MNESINLSSLWGDSDLVLCLPPCWRYTMLQRYNVVNLRVFATVVSGHMQQSKSTRSSNYLGKRIVSFQHFNSILSLFPFSIPPTWRRDLL